MNIKLAAAAALVAASALASPAAAETWYRVGVTSDSAELPASVTYIDADTLARSGATTVAWMYRRWARPVAGMIVLRTRYDVACRERTVVPRHMTATEASGQSDTWTPEAELEQVIPGSVLESFVDFACGERGDAEIAAAPDADAEAIFEAERAGPGK